MREEIMQKLKAYHRKQGIIFMSEKDAEDYFKGLVDLIEDLMK